MTSHEPHDSATAWASSTVRAVREHGPDHAAALLGYLQPEYRIDVATALAQAVDQLTGPDLDRERVRAGALAVVAAVEATHRGDQEAVERLRPDNLADALAQVNAACRMLAELLSQHSGKEYLDSVRSAMLTEPHHPTEDE